MDRSIYGDRCNVGMGSNSKKLFCDQVNLSCRKQNVQCVCVSVFFCGLCLWLLFGLRETDLCGLCESFFLFFFIGSVKCYMFVAF